MSGWRNHADDGGAGGERVVLPEGEFGEGGSASPDGNLSARSRTRGALRLAVSNWPRCASISRSCASSSSSYRPWQLVSLCPSSTPPRLVPAPEREERSGCRTQGNRRPACAEAVTRRVGRGLEAGGRCLRPAASSSAHEPASPGPGDLVHIAEVDCHSRARRRVARPVSTSPSSTCDFPSGTSARVSTSLAPAARATESASSQTATASAGRSVSA